jgi:threonine/homoserine/homoserine lactone efflux protein
MNLTLLAGAFTFAAVAAFTPGPNNLIALASGATFGFRRALPQVAGVGVGFGSMLLLIGLGLGALFTAFPVLYTVLKYAAIAYLLWLAWQIARSGAIGEGQTRARPMTFWGAAAFQWVNPKGWVAALTAVSTFTDPSAYWPSVGALTGLNVVLAMTAVSAWAAFGLFVRGWLSSPRRQTVFNVGMAVLLVLSVVPSLLH